jgi:MoxR-like ATPase
MFYVNVHYPSAEEEVEIVRSTTISTRPVLEKVLSPQQIRELQELVLRVPVADHVVRHAVELVRATRPREAAAPEFVRDFVEWGAGPRASQFLVLGAKARAVLDGRLVASIEDVRALARPVLVHRVLTNFRAESEGVKSEDLVARVLDHVKA